MAGVEGRRGDELRVNVNRHSGRLYWAGLGLLGALLVLGLAGTWMRLPAVAATPLPVYGQVSDFALTNQEGRGITLADLKGHVWVADIIFTRCAGPCPVMTRQMRDIQQGLPAGSRARLVTLTTDPEFDTPPVLQQYAERFGADPKRWMFLTGTKKEIGRLAVDSLKLTTIEKKPEERQDPQDLFIHSTILVIVDQQGRLRKVCETTGDGVKPDQVRSEVLSAIRQLERES